MANTGDQTTQKLTGQCLCGAIAYEIEGELGLIVNCHCSKCRRWHGAAFRTRAAITRKQFKWLRGTEHLSEYHGTNDSVRTFCAICGSNLMSYLAAHPESIGLPLGGLEQDPGTRPVMNIFVGSKAPWYNICDGLPQHDEWPPGGADAVRIIKDE